MRLIIAEKPSVAQAIADVLGGGRKAQGYIDIPGQDTKVSWCYGHLLEQAKPESYVEGGKVEARHLPVIPEQFQMLPREKATAQVSTLRALLKDATEVVNAGDADREGQLLVDELFPYLGWRGKTLRLWLSSLDAESVARGLASLKSNADFEKLFDSALSRQRADWLVSLNCSIAMSRNLQAMGAVGAWSIGRVQTPTLALIVDRARAIADFKPRDHYLVEASIGEGIKARWQIPDDLLLDGLLLEKAAAEAVALGVVGQPMRVTKFESKPGSRAAPMPYTLGALQTAASARLGLSASDTLAAAQALYEARVTSYPRTDCTYLPDELRSKAETILQTLGAEGTPGLNPQLKHGAWNTAKVEAHHGIVPTGVDPASAQLDEKARKVFGLIRESYIRLFLPAEKFEVREAVFESGGAGAPTFQAKSRQVLEPGWTKFGEGEENDHETQTRDAAAPLPMLAADQSLQCSAAEVLAKRTARPKPYTDGTLIAAMKSVHKLVEDPQLKSRLKETSGLGTEATRAGMIETLIDRNYIERRGKDLVPRARGEQLITWLRLDVGTRDLTDPGATALQEDALADIAAGRLAMSDFMLQVVDSSRRLCQLLLAGKYIDEASLKLSACPACNGARCAQRTSKAGLEYHRCLDCQAAFANVAGKPGKRYEERKEGDPKPAAPEGPKCPKDKKPTFRNETKSGKTYYRCGVCKGAWWPDREKAKKLGTPWEARS